jgi:thiol-disulfide isomerase/thioredoxin
MRWVVLLLAFFASQPAQAAESRFAPVIAFVDAEGREKSLADYSGKVLIVDFWASWCVPCRAEMPAFDRLQQKFSARGLQIVPIAVDARGLPAVEAFYRDSGVANLPIYLDPSREAAKKIGFAGIPSALIVDRRGREAARIEGPINWESSRITALLERLLNEN